MTKFFIYARRLHRLLVVVIAFLILVMAGTGFFLKYPLLGKKLVLNVGLLRYLHNNLSPFFSLVLFLMLLSGLFMYFFPLLKKKN